MAGGSQKKTCSNCGEKIYCELKICSLCNHPQPQHVRLQKMLDKFQSQQKQWLSSMKKNNIKSHVLDDAAILLEKLYALGMKPLLLIAHPLKVGTGKCQIKLMLPMHAHLSTSAKTCLDNVDAIYKLMVEGWTRLNPDQLPQEENFILHLVPCDQSPQQETPATITKPGSIP
ncbi:uncharacterized protein LOC143751686 [Siphateles boraxobius]|uniref:uncharacterized protein LOC143751686 n=1 Tax=Siphateles boraxobius TaxID=180520 RepID=UPI004064A804